MGDPLSTAASIAGLMSLADTVFRYVFKYVRGAVNAKKEVETIFNEISGLSAVLRHLHVLASELEAEASFEPTLRMQHLTHCKQTLETLRNRVKKAADDFDNKTKWEGITRRLKWPLSASETQDLLSDISRCKETLALATTADTMRKLQIFLTNQADLDKKLNKKLDNITHILERDEVDVRKRLILDFFMKPDANPKSNLSQSIKLRHTTTGSWLTTSHAFRAWLDTPGSRLWLNGIPGGGKTVLAGAVIQEALSIGSPDTAVAFFFCDYKNPATLLPLNIIGAIASQIARQNDGAFDLLRGYYEELHPARALDKVADVDEIRAVVAKMSQLFKQVTVIIDGLDECGENTDSVLESISELAVSTASTSLALFSRDELNIRSWLHEDFEEISIEAHKGDIELFVRAEMEHRIQSSRLKLSNLKIKDEIVEELITFRWVVCQLDYLCEFATDADRLNALKELPPTLPDSYRLLERLNRRPVRVQRMVQLSLQFIAFFPESLSIKALCQAVSTPQARIDETNTISERDIVLGCSSLIRKSPDGESLEFAHFSVLEFLQDDLLSKTPGLEAYRLTRREDRQVLATQCLKFLQLDNFNYIPPCFTEWEQFRAEQFQSYPFYQYAAIYWPGLAREGLGDSSLLSAARSLFHPSVTQNFRGWIELFLNATSRRLYASDANYQQNPSKYLLRLHSIASDQNLRPLHVAAALNLPEICSFLIGEGANVNEVCSMGTPLLLAVVSLFASKDEAIGFPDCQSPLLRHLLHCASRRNSTISCLIEAGASFAKLSELYLSRRLFLTTSIIDCLVKDFGPAIQLLGQCINPTDSEIDNFETYLKTWTRTDHPRELEAPLLNLIRYLKESSAYSTDRGFRLGKALWSACSKLDFAFTSDPTLTDSRISLSYEALVEKTMAAIRNDDFDALRSYLNDGRVDAHSSYSYGNFHGTLLCFALRDDSLACVDQLLALGSDPCSKDDHGRVAVHHCCCHGDGRTLRLLAKLNVPLLAEDRDGNNLWHYSAQKMMWTASFLDVLFNLSKDATWKALLTRNKAGQTPLTIALSRQKHATNEDSENCENFENCEWKALMFIDCCNQVPDFWLQHDPLFPTVTGCFDTRASHAIA
ncbi:NACHT domain-containing protein [Fusarium sp. LHS14.1]|nr:NACHT domain-containing protein [Fusarium sp. LHS14.1]